MYNIPEITDSTVDNMTYQSLYFQQEKLTESDHFISRTQL